MGADCYFKYLPKSPYLGLYARGKKPTYYPIEYDKNQGDIYIPVYRGRILLSPKLQVGEKWEDVTSFVDLARPRFTERVYYDKQRRDLMRAIAKAIVGNSRTKVHVLKEDSQLVWDNWTLGVGVLHQFSLQFENNSTLEKIDVAWQSTLTPTPYAYYPRDKYDYFLFNYESDVRITAYAGDKEREYYDIIRQGVFADKPVKRRKIPTQHAGKILPTDKVLLERVKRVVPHLSPVSSIADSITAVSNAVSYTGENSELYTYGAGLRELKSIDKYGSKRYHAVVTTQDIRFLTDTYVIPDLTHKMLVPVNIKQVGRQIVETDIAPDGTVFKTYFPTDVPNRINYREEYSRIETAYRLSLFPRVVGISPALVEEKQTGEPFRGDWIKEAEKGLAEYYKLLLQLQKTKEVTYMPFSPAVPLVPFSAGTRAIDILNLDYMSAPHDLVRHEGSVGFLLPNPDVYKPIFDNKPIKIPFIVGGVDFNFVDEEEVYLAVRGALKEYFSWGGSPLEVETGKLYITTPTGLKEYHLANLLTEDMSIEDLKGSSTSQTQRR